MSTIIFIGVMCVVWAVSLLNGTGVGQAYNTTEYFSVILYIAGVFTALFLWKYKRDKYAVCIFGAMTLVFVFSSLLQGRGFVAVEYLSCFMLVAAVGQIPVDEKSFRLAGLIFAGLGAVFLIIYNFGSALSGWNSNSIAMIGLFSFLIFSATFLNVQTSKPRLFLVAVTAFYTWMIWLTDSRSCLVTIIITAFIILFFRDLPQLLQSRKFIVFILLVPLLVALVTVFFSQLGMTSTLDAWSVEHYGKTFFNGRDTTWIEGMKSLLSHPFFGTGDLVSGVWHNSAMACLSTYGIFGYVSWIACLYYILETGMDYTSDNIVCGCMLVFLLINMQQSVELGMLSPNPTLLIYLPLGVMLGRVKYLRKDLYDTD